MRLSKEIFKVKWNIIIVMLTLVWFTTLYTYYLLDDVPSSMKNIEPALIGKILSSLSIPVLMIAIFVEEVFGGVKVTPHLPGLCGGNEGVLYEDVAWECWGWELDPLSTPLSGWVEGVIIYLLLLFLTSWALQIFTRYTIVLFRKSNQSLSN